MRRRRVTWDLVACGWDGHAFVGTDAAELRPEDALFAREEDSLRWHRCLRCDSWAVRPQPTSPTRHYPPNRDEIEVPFRGKALSDRIVLRVIAVDRAFHFLILGVLGVAVLLLQAHESVVRSAFYRVLAALQGGVAGGPVQTTGHVGFVGELDKLFLLRSHTLSLVGVALLAYAALEGLEAVGLWLTKRWAEYLTFLATTILLPLEVYEIANRASALKVIGFLINVAVVIYLLFAKRLFGLRGGGRAEEAERASDMSWEAIERATPPELLTAGPGPNRASTSPAR